MICSNKLHANENHGLNRTYSASKCSISGIQLKFALKEKAKTVNKHMILD